MFKKALFSCLALAALSGCSSEKIEIVDASIDTSKHVVSGFQHDPDVGYLLSMNVKNTSTKAIEFVAGDIQCRDSGRSVAWKEFPFVVDIEGGIEPGETREISNSIEIEAFQRLRKDHSDAVWSVTIDDQNWSPVKIK